jgi:hypothetical protein
LIEVKSQYIFPITFLRFLTGFCVFNEFLRVFWSFFSDMLVFFKVLWTWGLTLLFVKKKKKFFGFFLWWCHLAETRSIFLELNSHLAVVTVIITITKNFNKNHYKTWKFSQKMEFRSSLAESSSHLSDQIKSKIRQKLLKNLFKAMSDSCTCNKSSFMLSSAIFVNFTFYWGCSFCSLSFYTVV